MNYTKTQIIKAAAAVIPVGALAVHYGAPYVFNVAVSLITVEAGTTAATALYVASGAVAAAGAIAAVAAVGYGIWKLWKRFGSRKIASTVATAATAVVETAVAACGAAGNAMDKSDETDINVRGRRDTDMNEALTDAIDKKAAVTSAVKKENEAVMEMGKVAKAKPITDNFSPTKSAMAEALAEAGLIANH